MKNLIRQGGAVAFLVSALIFQFIFTDIFPQSLNDYKSKTSGDWTDASSWYRYNGSSWAIAQNPPDVNAGRISILSGHIIYYNNQDINFDQLVIEAGGQLTVNSGVYFITTDGPGDDVTLYGTLYFTGIVPSSMPGNGVIKNGGTVIYYSTSTPLNLLSFFSVKEAGSNWVYQGSNTTQTVVSLGGRIYENLSFVSISGDYGINFGGTLPLTVEGNLNVGNGVNITVTNTAVNLFKGNYTISGAITYSTGIQNFSFCGNSQQVLTGTSTLNFENVNVPSGSSVKLNSPLNVTGTMNVGGTIDCAYRTIGGAGAFSLLSGALLKTSAANGVNGNLISYSTLAPDAGFEFYGTSPQNTGTKLSSCSFIKISNPSGVTLSNSLTAGSWIEFASGKLFAGSYDFVLGYSAVTTGAGSSSYIVTNGSGVLKKINVPTDVDFVFPIGNSYYTPVTINYTGAPGDFSVRAADTVDIRTNNNYFVKKKWTVAGNVSGGSSALLKLSWNLQDQNAGFNPSGNVCIGRFDGITLTETPASVSGIGPFTASAAGFGALGEFIVGNESTLPAELISFVSSVRFNVVTLRWKTSSENFSEGYCVERKKSEDTMWTSAGFVQSYESYTGCRTYSFSDEVVSAGSYTYRLKQTDRNGGFAYYYLKENCIVKFPPKFRLAGNYPNPFNSGFFINYEIPENCEVVVNFFELAGRKIKEAYFREYAGYTKRYFDFSGFASGIYIYYVKAMLSGGIMSAVGKCVLIK